MRAGRKTALVGAAVAAAIVAGTAAFLAGRRGSNAPNEAATADGGFAARFAGFRAAPEPNGNLAKVVWPAFVTNAGPEVQRLYEFQIENGGLMRYMPCFCGCGGEAGHRSNRDCYVPRVAADGSVVLDPMAPT